MTNRFLKNKPRQKGRGGGKGEKRVQQCANTDVWVGLI